MITRPLRRAALLTLALAALPAAPASAVHWPHFGGDAARSGLQPLGGGAAPFTEAYALQGLHVDTSIVTTAGGGPDVQRLAFGTTDGSVHLRRLADGAAITPAGGVDVVGNDQVHPFGEDTAGFADTSSATALGQLFVLHNDAEPDGFDVEVALAQLDETTGRLVQDVSLPGTQGGRLRSGILATGPDAEGTRSLFAVVESGIGLVSENIHLLRVRIAAAASPEARVVDVDMVPVDGGTPTATPALAFLADGTGAVAPFVLVGTNGGVRSFRVSDLSHGPAASGLAGEVLTVSAPVTAGGLIAGAPMSGAPRAPFLTALVDRHGFTQVARLVADGDRLRMAAVSAELEGAPGAGLADTQLASADGASAGAIVVPTDRALHVLDGSTLAVRSELRADSEHPHGFAHVAPAVLGDVAFITRSDGEHVAIQVSTGRPLPAAGFNESPANRESHSAVGQPSLTRGFVQLASDRGVVVYRATQPQPAQQPATVAPAPSPATGSPASYQAPGRACSRRLTGGRGADRLVGTRGGDRLSGRGGADVLSGRRGDDCLLGGAGNDVIRAGRGRDVIRCGAGRDVAYAERRDSVSDCERVLRTGRR